MDNLNTPSKSIDTVNKLIDQINSTCDSLISALEINTEKVSNYNMTIIKRMEVNSQFIDRVVKNIIDMKSHLNYLKKGINGHLIGDTLDLETIVSGLRETSGKLNELLISDNNFNNIYSMPISEIQSMIEKLLDEIKIGEILLAY